MRLQTIALGRLRSAQTWLPTVALLVTALFGLGAASPTNAVDPQDLERQKQVCTDIRAAATFLQEQEREAGGLPEPTAGLVTLGSLPAFLKAGASSRMNETDPWGHPYFLWSNSKYGHLILSTGKDGHPDKPYYEKLSQESDPLKTLETFCEGADPTPGADVLYVNGSFCKLPAEAVHGKPGSPFTEIDRQKVTMADMRAIATTIENYSIDNNIYPVLTRGTATLGLLKLLVVPNYINVLPITDAWGAPYLYWSNGDNYLIVSQNKGLDHDCDAILEGRKDTKAALTEICGGAGNRPGADILFANGQFCQWPAEVVKEDTPHE